MVCALLDAEQLKPWSTLRHKLRSLYERRPHCVRHSARNLRRQSKKQFVDSLCCHEFSEK